MSELYQLPDGWEWKKLSDIGKISTGKTPPKKNKEFYENGTIRFVKPPNLQNSIDVTKTESDEFITEDGAKKSTLLPKNSLMVCCIGSLGKFALSTENVITNQQINSIVFNDEIINYKYGFYYGFMFEKLLNNVANEAIVKIVNKTIFSNLDIPLPPLSEQQRIVSKLDNLFEKIDKAIALHQKNMDEADAFMGSILNDVFGELEEKYGKTPISDVMKISNKTLVPNDNEEYNYVGLENIESHNGKLVDFTPTLGSEIKSSKVIFEKGMVLYGKLRPYLNKVWISNFDGVATTEILPFYPIDENGLDMNYVKYYFLSPSYLNKVMNNCSGARMPRLTTKFIKSDEAYIPLPSISIQQKVVKYLDEISQKIEKVKQVQKEKMDSLKALKASILDKAFRGEL
jgi:type I restriction enzyme S subunit